MLPDLIELKKYVNIKQIRARKNEVFYFELCLRE